MWRGVVVLGGVLAAGGCQRERVAWQATTVRRGALAGDVRLALDEAGRAHWLPVPAPVIPPPPQISPSECRGSLRISAPTALDLYAAWWSVRPDRSVTLKVARSDDGGQTWRVPVVAEARDRSALGCARPAPAIAAAARGGYVHVAYFIQTPEGPGLFFTHSMDRGVTFHAPVTIVYGERAGAAALAATGDTIAVAFEDPNAVTPQIALALSRTAGHIFEDRLPVSSPSVPARAPHVALRGRRIAVAWTEHAGGDTVVVVRSGVLR